MKKMKNKKLKSRASEDTKEIKTLIIITLIIIVVSLGLYFLSDSLNNKKNKDDITEAVINYKEITIGTIFTRPYKEYYIFAYKNDDDNAYTFDNLLATYEAKENHQKIYYVDLAKKFNNFVLSEEANKKPTKSSEVKIKDYALILIKDGKVSKYYEKISEIEKVLS
ncbi:MAG: hypothetical protein PHX04_00610 [Bacilli bacterium]|nr:hypothetical protein [Bacilli bacterium]